MKSLLLHHGMKRYLKRLFKQKKKKNVPIVPRDKLTLPPLEPMKIPEWAERILRFFKPVAAIYVLITPLAILDDPCNIFREGESPDWLNEYVLFANLCLFLRWCAANFGFVSNYWDVCKIHSRSRALAVFRPKIDALYSNYYEEDFSYDLG